MLKKKKACPKRPDGVQVLGRSQLLFGNSLTPCCSERSSSQQLEHTHMQSNVTTTIILLVGPPPGLLPGWSRISMLPLVYSLLHHSLASLALSPNHLTCPSDVHTSPCFHLFQPPYFLSLHLFSTL